MSTNAEFMHQIFRGLRSDETCWSTAFVADPNDADGRDWGGNAGPPKGVPDAPHGNAYFSVASLKLNCKPTKRRKDHFSRLFCLVIDDAEGKYPDPSWTIETSAGNFQVGYCLANPIEDVDVANRLHEELARVGVIKADKNGNNAVRYVRLPAAVNTKNGGKFPCVLKNFDPDLVYQLHDLIDALELNLGYVLNGNASQPHQSNSGQENGRQGDAELIRLILTAESYHDPLLKLTARYAQRGMDADAIVATVKGFMDANGETSDRWKNRYADIERITRDALRKFSHPQPEPATHAEAGKEERIAFPPPFRGPMLSATNALLNVAVKQQPELALLAALIGMASSCNGQYALPSGMRLNLFGCGAVGTGEGKELPRHLAERLNSLAGGVLIGNPASGQGLEDVMHQSTGTLLPIDEIAHFFSATEGSRTPPHLIALSANMLKFFSAGATTYKTRERAVAKGILPSREIPHPTLSILGFSTPERLGKSLTVGQIESGLLGRFLFAIGNAGVEPRRIRARLVLPEDVLEVANFIDADFRDETQGNLAQATGVYEILVSVDDDADKELARLLIEFNGARNDHRDPFAKALLTRSVEKLERIAGVIAVWDSPKQPTITLEHVEWARKFVIASDASLIRFASDFMHGGETQANAGGIMKAIKRALSGEFAEGRVTWSALMKEGKVPRSLLLKVSRLSAKDFVEAVEHLSQLGDIVTGKFRAATGKEEINWIGLRKQDD